MIYIEKTNIPVTGRNPNRNYKKMAWVALPLILAVGSGIYYYQKKTCAIDPNCAWELINGVMSCVNKYTLQPCPPGSCG